MSLKSFPSQYPPKKSTLLKVIQSGDSGEFINAHNSVKILWPKTKKLILIEIILVFSCPKESILAEVIP